MESKIQSIKELKEYRKQLLEIKKQIKQEKGFQKKYVNVNKKNGYIDTLSTALISGFLAGIIFAISFVFGYVLLFS